MKPPPAAPPADDLDSRKSELRTRVREARAALTPQVRATESAAASARLLGMPFWADAGTVSAYLSIGEEFDTAAIVGDILRSGRRLLLPRIVDRQSRATRHLVLHAVDDPATDTLPGPWGIREPDPRRCPEVDPDEVDLVLVPGLAFDRQGGRLGYGAGFYDRLLAQTRAGCLRVATAFALQCREPVPMQPHDQRIDWLITAADAWRTVAA
ncbi:MAG: 5-formyltetrahydrofolate cyclo-ligase [Pseudomonadota bacterium]